MRRHGRRRRHSEPAPGRRLSQQFVAGQAGVPRTALRVQDSEFGRPARRAVPVPRDAYFRPLAHDVPAEADPGPPAQLQPEGGDLGDRAGYGRRQIRRLEHHQPDLGPTCQRRQSVQSLAQSGRGQTRATARLGRQIQQQQVHRSVLEEHRRHRQRLFQSVRREDDEPFQRHAPSRRLHRIQASPEVQVGGYSAGGLDPGDGPQPEGGLAARPVSLESGSGGSRQPAQPEDGIQRPKAAG